MTDDEVRKLDQLFDKKLSPIKEALSNQIGELSKRVENGFTTVTAQLDTIAGHLEGVDEKLTSVDKRLSSVEVTQSEHSEQLERIERRLVKHDDRFDILEAKTAHLPTPPRSR